jgi:hypothetical protein
MYYERLSGAAKATSELYHALRDLYPTVNILVDPAGGPAGPCMVQLFGDIELTIQVNNPDTDAVMFDLHGDDDRASEMFVDQATLLARIADLVKKVQQ